MKQKYQSKEIPTMTNQQRAGHKAVHTRTLKSLDRQVADGTLSVMEAAGKKSHATRRLNKVMAG